MTLRKAWIPVAALVALNAWLVWAGVEIWTRTPASETNTELDSSSRHSSRPTPAIGTRRPPRPEFNVVTAKNLFHPSRKPPIIEEEDDKDGPEAREASDYALLGTVILDNGERLAYLSRKGEDSAQRLYIGEDFDGYRIVSIEASEIRMRKRSEELIVKCFNRPEEQQREAKARAGRSKAKNRRDYLRERRLKKARERAEKDSR